jgi:hypothetical protein
MYDNFVLAVTIEVDEGREIANLSGYPGSHSIEEKLSYLF